MMNFKKKAEGRREEAKGGRRQMVGIALTSKVKNELFLLPSISPISVSFYSFPSPFSGFVLSIAEDLHPFQLQHSA